MTKWIFYSITVVFAIYWVGNLILWYPWSINPNLGIVLMLTLMPIIWGVGIYLCLIRYNGKNLFTGGFITSLIMLTCAVVMDYVFFGLIRGAFNDLYKPTTFYGYGFLLLLPFIELLILKKVIIKKRRTIITEDFITTGAIGLACLVIQIVLIRL